MKDQREDTAFDGKCGNSPKEIGGRGGKNDACQWLVDPLDQSHRSFSDGEKMGDAAHGVKELGEINGEDVSVDPVTRNQ